MKLAWRAAGVAALAAVAAVLIMGTAPSGPADPVSELEVFLAREYADAGRFAAAARAYERALLASPRVAADPQIWCELADALGMAQGGALRGRPQELIDQALALRPHHPRALEMAGSAQYEAGNYEQALKYWQPLLAQLPASSTRHQELAAAIERTRRLALKERLRAPSASRALVVRDE